MIRHDPSNPPSTDLLNALTAERLPCATPAFVYDRSAIASALRTLRGYVHAVDSQLLYSVKALDIVGVLRDIAPHVDGFAVSSPFEARLVRDLDAAPTSLHFVAPTLLDSDIEVVAQLCDYVSLNSLSQWRALRSTFSNHVSLGLRINPQLSYVSDLRYDPCRPHSKLGIPIRTLLASLALNDALIDGLSGLHFHNNADSSNLAELLATVRHVESTLESILTRISWINVGGGYLFDDPTTIAYFNEAADILRSRYGLQVFVEPGAAIIRNAAYLVTTVVDVFDSDGKMIAVLDTTTNHAPEVFEFDYQPALLNHRAGAAHQYILAGCSCLAGDLFGTYAFEAALEVGTTLVFAEMGAYSLVKAHMFNGINLPAVCALSPDGQLSLEKEFTYEDFLSSRGVVAHANT